MKKAQFGNKKKILERVSRLVSISSLLFRQKNIDKDNIWHVSEYLRGGELCSIFSAPRAGQRAAVKKQNSFFKKIKKKIKLSRRKTRHSPNPLFFLCAKTLFVP